MYKASSARWRLKRANGMVMGGLRPTPSFWAMYRLGSHTSQNVLQGLTGYAEPGSFAALMGPSGSGKSTLLDALSSHLAANAILSGTILLNGRKTKLSFGTAAYVTQDDTLIGTLTVGETIAYSARLRLPDKMPWSEKRTHNYRDGSSRLR